MKILNYTYILIVSTILLSSTLFAETSDNNSSTLTDSIILPFAFSSDSTGTAGGVGVIKQGLFQPQTTLVASIFAGVPQEITTNPNASETSFKGALLYFSNYRLPFTQRYFFSMLGIVSYFPRAKYYTKGSNDSSQDDVFNTSGDTNFINTSFRYVLPIGEGLFYPEGIQKIENGFCTGREGCGDNRPFVTGRTTLGIKTFYQKDTFDNFSYAGIDAWKTNGLRFFLHHDNTDFSLNPSRGYRFELQYSRDFGEGDSTQSWDFVEFKYNHYIDLPTFSFTKQNVLAMILWTGYSNSWDSDNELLPGIDAHRPPTWEGARLGGFYKMRGYHHNRFSDKAAVYASAEYRAILNYNPLKDNKYIPAAVDWFQVVAFAEVGRVHDQYNVDLLTDMKYDVGLSLRALVAELPMRIDVAYGEEGVNAWVMVNQPFDF